MMDKNRLNHIYKVAKLMEKKASKLNLNANEMFLLGLLHDVGYEIDKTNHEFAGGEFLKTQNYKYAKEVEFHGVPNCNYSSTALDLLNWCDMHINFYGEFVSFKKRLDDIASRHNKNSLIYKNAEILIKELENNQKLKEL